MTSLYNNMAKLFSHSWPNLTKAEIINIHDELQKKDLDNSEKYGLSEGDIGALVLLLNFSKGYYRSDSQVLCVFPIVIDYLIKSHQNYANKKGNADANNLSVVKEINKEIRKFFYEFLCRDINNAITYYFLKIGIKDNPFTYIVKKSHLLNSHRELVGSIIAADLTTIACKKVPINILEKLLYKLKEETSLKALKKEASVSDESAKSFNQKFFKFEAQVKNEISLQKLFTELFDFFSKTPLDVNQKRKNLNDFLEIIYLYSKSIFAPKDKGSNISMQALKQGVDSYINSYVGKLPHTDIQRDDRYLNLRDCLIKNINPIDFESLLISYQKFSEMIFQISKGSETDLVMAIKNAMMKHLLMSDSGNITLEPSNSNSLEGSSIEHIPEEVILNIITMAAKTPKDLLRLQGISRSFDRLIFDKAIWQRFMPESLKNHQYLPIVYKFFARAYGNAEYQYFLEKWLVNSEEFHHNLLKWTDAGQKRDYLLLWDNEDPILPLLLGLEWGKYYFQHPPFNILNEEQQKALALEESIEKILPMRRMTWEEAEKWFSMAVSLGNTLENIKLFWEKLPKNRLNNLMLMSNLANTADIATISWLLEALMGADVYSFSHASDLNHTYKAIASHGSSFLLDNTSDWLFGEPVIFAMMPIEKVIGVEIGYWLDIAYFYEDKWLVIKDNNKVYTLLIKLYKPSTTWDDIREIKNEEDKSFFLKFFLEYSGSFDISFKDYLTRYHKSVVKFLTATSLSKRKFLMTRSMSSRQNLFCRTVFDSALEKDHLNLLEWLWEIVNYKKDHIIVRDNPLVVAEIQSYIFEGLNTMTEFARPTSRVEEWLRKKAFDIFATIKDNSFQNSPLLKSEIFKEFLNKNAAFIFEHHLPEYLKSDLLKSWIGEQIVLNVSQESIIGISEDIKKHYEAIAVFWYYIGYVKTPATFTPVEILLYEAFAASKDGHLLISNLIELEGAVTLAQSHQQIQRVMTRVTKQIQFATDYLESIEEVSEPLLETSRTHLPKLIKTIVEGLNNVKDLAVDQCSVIEEKFDTEDLTPKQKQKSPAKTVFFLSSKNNDEREDNDSQGNDNIIILETKKEEPRKRESHLN